jgi:predicted metalloprotease with PDZ domain
MVRSLALAGIAWAAGAATGVAQHPLRQPIDAVQMRVAASQPIVGYTVRVADGDLGGFDVEIRIRNARDTVMLAMAAHPEYDDRYWRFVEGLRVDAPRGGASITRADSSLWRLVAPGGESIVRYRIHLPPPEPAPRAAWRPFLDATGGLVGGPHSFMYLVDTPLIPSHVAIEVPAGWDIATGLEPTADPHIFFAPSAEVLIDSPLLVGRLASRRFVVDGVPHRVAYWPQPTAPGAAPPPAFDTAAFVGGIERVAREAVRLFGRAPYRDYTFLFRDAAYGGLEHYNSVTLGVTAASLATEPHGHIVETAHEFLHTWNLMRLRPAERGGLSRTPAGRTTGLWWSEGLTMFYADLLPRRAGLATYDSTRIAHLEASIGRYLANPGNTAVSPERASYAEYGGQPGSLGDYDPSVHLQGEMLGAMLDLMVRDATDDRRTIDDVMRAMMARFSGERGFTGGDIERTVAEVCGCVVAPFFAAHVRGTTPIDFDRYLRSIGLRTRVTSRPVRDREGRPRTDLSIYAWQPPGGGGLSLLITNPAGAWGRAGLHTNDRLLSIDGTPITTWPELRRRLGAVAIGDTVRVAVQRPSGPFSAVVVASGFDEPVVRIEELPDATDRQKRMRARWVSGAP